ncbi:MAG: hypothetical protein ABI867_22245 [Kofleriaceae bacterium]
MHGLLHLFLGSSRVGKLSFVLGIIGVAVLIMYCSRDSQSDREQRRLARDLGAERAAFDGAEAELTAALRSIETGYVAGVALAGERDRIEPVAAPPEMARRIAGLQPFVEAELAASKRWLVLAAAYLDLDADPAIASSLEPTQRRIDRLVALHAELARLASTIGTPDMARQLEVTRTALHRPR